MADMTNRCILCDKELELVRDFQPFGGGEVRFIFSYGSREFDECSGTTNFFGIICDECAENYVGKMDKRTYDI